MCKYNRWCNTALFAHCPFFFLHRSNWKGFMSLTVTQRQGVRCPFLVPSMVAECNVVPSCSAVSSTSSKSSWFCLTSSNSWLKLTWLFFNCSSCLTCIRKWTSDLFCWQKSGWGGGVPSSTVLRWIVKNFSVKASLKQPVVCEHGGMDLY